MIEPSLRRCRARFGRRRRRSDEGSAVAEFTMTSALVVVVFLVVCQFAYAVHVRSTLTMAAAEGARVGARVGADGQEARAKAVEIAEQSLSSHYAQDVESHLSSESGAPVMKVDIAAPVPVLGPWGVGLTLHTSARAVMEERDAAP